MQLAQPIPAPVGQPIQNATPGARVRDYEVFELPPHTPIKEREVTFDHGQTRWAILEIHFALLSVAEEKRVNQRAGNDGANPMILSALRTTESMRLLTVAPIVSGLDAAGKPTEEIDFKSPTTFQLSTHDATAEGAWVAMHPGLRDLCLMAYGMISSVDETAATLFLKSRRRVTR